MALVHRHIETVESPYVIYADFECFATKMDTCTPSPSHSYTEKLTRHIPSGFAYKLVALNDDLSRDLVVYRGDDVADMFIQLMLKIQDRMDLVYRNPKPLQMTMEDRSVFRSAEYCHVCHRVSWSIRPLFTTYTVITTRLHLKV